MRDLTIIGHLSCNPFALEILTTILSIRINERRDRYPSSDICAALRKTNRDEISDASPWHAAGNVGKHQFMKRRNDVRWSSRFVFLLYVRLVCSSLYSCVFGWIDFLFLWLSSGSSCFSKMKGTYRFSRYTLNLPWDTETAAYTKPQVSHVFFKIPKNIATTFLCDIFFFLQNIAKRDRKRLVHQVKYMTVSRRYRRHHSHWMTIPKFWPKPIPRPFSWYKIFRNRNWDFFFWDQILQNWNWNPQKIGQSLENEKFRNRNVNLCLVLSFAT